MAIVPEPTYITADEVAEQTSITALATLAEENNSDFERMLQEAEDQIDAYVGPQPHHPDDDNTDRVFPREMDIDDDGAAVIPYRVSRAALKQVEWLYVQWWGSRVTTQTPLQHAVSSREIGGDGSYSETRAVGGMDFSAATLCEQAKALLSGFVSRMAAISVTDPKTSPEPT